MSLSLHARFVMLLPRIEAHAKIYFRDIRCAAKRADCIADVIALAWCWFVRLENRGKDASAFATAIATFAAKAVRCGRRVAGVEKAKDAMNSQAQQRHGFTVEPLPDRGAYHGNLLAEALCGNWRNVTGFVRFAQRRNAAAPFVGPFLTFTDTQAWRHLSCFCARRLKGSDWLRHLTKDGGRASWQQSFVLPC